MSWISGLMKPFVKAVTTVVNAAPMTMPTARSTTLPRMMKSLKPWNTFFTSTPGSAEGSFRQQMPTAVRDKLRPPGDPRKANASSVERVLLGGHGLVDRRIGAQDLDQAAHLE